MIVVLTDGSNNRGVAPATAAKEAAARGVRVFTIGYGTSNPAGLSCGSGQFGGFGGGGFAGPAAARATRWWRTDSALQQISKTTGGSFYRAQDAAALNRALAHLPGELTIVRRQEDIAAGFAALGGLLVAAAVALSLWWNRARRPVPRPGASPATA